MVLAGWTDTQYIKVTVQYRYNDYTDYTDFLKQPFYSHLCRESGSRTLFLPDQDHDLNDKKA